MKEISGENREKLALQDRISRFGLLVLSFLMWIHHETIAKKLVSQWPSLDHECWTKGILWCTFIFFIFMLFIALMPILWSIILWLIRSLLRLICYPCSFMLQFSLIKSLSKRLTSLYGGSQILDFTMWDYWPCVRKDGFYKTGIQGYQSVDSNKTKKQMIQLSKTKREAVIDTQEKDNGSCEITPFNMSKNPIKLTLNDHLQLWALLGWHGFIWSVCPSLLSCTHQFFRSKNT